VLVVASAIDAAIGRERDVATSGEAVLVAASACKKLIVSGTPTNASIGDESSSFVIFGLSSRGFDAFRLFPVPSCTVASCFFLLFYRGMTFSSYLQLVTICFRSNHAVNDG
jgi:hypothetical protein